MLTMLNTCGKRLSVSARQNMLWRLTYYCSKNTITIFRWNLPTTKTFMSWLEETFEAPEGLKLKDMLFQENIGLQRELDTLMHSAGEGMKPSACVICMDNLANIVCMPCKHLE